MIKKHIPNTITCFNLISGCLGIIMTLQGKVQYAPYFIGIAAAFDLLDGMVARMLHVKSEIGKQLDSLADVVSFGVLPGFIMYQMMLTSNYMPASDKPYNVFAFVWLLIPVFSALRLARFNVDTRQTTFFIGLPVPANAIFIGSLGLIYFHDLITGNSNWFTHIIGNYYVLSAITILFSYLLLSELRLFSLKMDSLKWEDAKPQFIWAACTLLFLMLFSYLAIPLSILVYIIVSLVFFKPEAK